MRSFKWYAILLTIVLAVSGCCPANVITAVAAETISIEESVEETTETVTEEADSETAEETVDETDSVTEADTEEESIAASEADAGEESIAASEEDTEEEADTAAESDTAELAAEEETADKEVITEDKKEESADQEEISDEEELAEEESVVPEGGASSDEMFAAYVDNAFGIGGKDSRMLKARRPSAGSRLTGYDRALYDYISSQLPLIESGERTETIFTIKISDMGLEKTEWTFAELYSLGVTTVVGEDGKLTAEAKQVIREQVNYDWDLIINALLADHPYLLYWYKKNASSYLTPYSLSKYTKSENPEENRVWLSSNCIAKLPVQEEYASGDYEVDPSIGQTVRDSAAYAALIVEQHADEDDYQKLVSYRDEVCRLASYNFSNFSETDYGDPWQLIWVFDQEPNTKVVCEGYSKAFQYLFNLSTFENDLGCLLITGSVDFGGGYGGGHMWNVVSMDDDRNYLVDLTNSDAGSTGSDRLFMIGARGTPESGYTVDIGYTYHYDEDALSIWNEEELSLYGEHARYYPCWRTFGEWEIVTAPTYTSEGLRRNQCTDCGLTVEEVMPMLVPTSVDDLDITGIAAKTYTGEPLTQDLVVMDGDAVLTEGVHYTVEYGNNTDATEDTPDAPATVTITGILENGYTGSVVKEFQIEKAPNAITVDTARIDEVYSIRGRTYTIGAEALGGNITYSSNNDGVQVSSEGKVTIEAGFLGEGNITITAGDNNYKTATKKVPVIVIPASVKDLIFTGIVSKTYTGDPLTQDLVVKDGDAVLTEGVHYTVEYANNTDATEDTPDAPATVTITGILENGYTGSVVKEFQIEKAPNAITVDTARIDEVYSIRGRTYTIGAEALGGNITYSSNNDGVQVSSEGKVTIEAGFLGEGNITITAGDNNYKTATKKVPVIVIPASVKDLIFTGIVSKTYTGDPLTQDLVVMDGDDVLTEGVHYTVEYSNNTEATEDTPASVTITGIDENGYTGTRTEEFQIEKAPNAITVGTASITKVYSTSKRTYAIGAAATGGEVTYSSNKTDVQVTADGKVTIGAGFLGKAIITITAEDSNYKTATKRVPIVVNPTMTCITGLTSPKAGQVLVTYKKNTIGTGYQIQLSLNKDFAPSVKAWVTSNTTLTRKIGSLKKGQKYYVRIRTYKLVDGVKYYSAWSAIKAIRVKK